MKKEKIVSYVVSIIIIAIIIFGVFKIRETIDSRNSDNILEEDTTNLDRELSSDKKKSIENSFSDQVDQTKKQKESIVKSISKTKVAPLSEASKNNIENSFAK